MIVSCPSCGALWQAGRTGGATAVAVARCGACEAPVPLPRAARRAYRLEGARPEPAPAPPAVPEVARKPFVTPVVRSRPAAPPVEPVPAAAATVRAPEVPPAEEGVPAAPLSRRDPSLVLLGLGIAAGAVGGVYAPVIADRIWIAPSAGAALGALAGYAGSVLWARRRS